MLKNLSKYMFTKDNLKHFDTLLDNSILTNKIEKYKTTNNCNTSKKKNNSKIFEIDKKDQLFWAFYIFLFGQEEYHLITNNFVIEKKFKIDTIIKIRENKNKLKMHKISKNFIENELANEISISLKTLNCLALLYSLNIIYIKDKILFIMNYNNEEIIKCKNIIENKDNKIKIIDLSEDVLQNLINTYYIIENINKPFNSITYYKLNDLINISKKLNLDITPKLKQNIYTEIQNKLSNFN